MTLRKTDLPTNCHLISFDSLDSTNEEAKKLASGGAKSGTVVWAREQVLGRGRYGRTWDSPYGNLYLSIIQRPTCFPSDATQLGFVTGVALAEALLSICNIEIALKWPNDIMANGKKASGILLESSINPNKRFEWLGIGVGLNIEKFPSDIENSTSLHKEGAEVTLEMDPASFDQIDLHGYIEAGINRVSLGGQSFDNNILEKLGRSHRKHHVLETCTWLDDFYQKGGLLDCLSAPEKL